MARLAAQTLGEGLGQTVVVENRPGGNGIIGTQAVLQAPADRYTVLGSASTHVLQHPVLKAPGYDPLAISSPSPAPAGRPPCW